MTSVTSLGRRAWRLETAAVSADLTCDGGHLGPVTFRLAGGRSVSPLSVCPWAEAPDSQYDPTLPDLLKILRGDFFCLPFGGNDGPVDGVTFPPHGRTACDAWLPDGGDGTRGWWRFVMDEAAPGLRVTKVVRLGIDAPVVYQQHVLDGGRGRMTAGYHPMLRLPDGPACGRVSVSPFVFGQVRPVRFERSEAGGRTSLRPGAVFGTLHEVPSDAGPPADLTRYPARPGQEDLVQLWHDARAGRLAWTAVVVPSAGWLWVTLHDARRLPGTLLWHSNGGRDYAPWSGRHVHVLGVEAVASYFDLGVAAAADNDATRRGLGTCLDLSAGPYDLRTAMTVVAVDANFGHVARVEASAGGATAYDADGRAVSLGVDVGWVLGG